MAAKTGHEAVVEQLLADGFDHIFGNPGTSEEGLLDAIERRPELKYVLVLQESVAVLAADGYARATNRPTAVQIHSTPGLGNAIGTLANARATRTPLVITAGQQDRRHLIAEPFLSGDLVAMASPVTKWTAEVHHVGDL